MAFAVKTLCKAYGGVDVLKNVDLTVQDGEIHVLLGANGAGKSTLIKCLSGAITPDSGEIIVGDERFTALTPKLSRQAGVAVVYGWLYRLGGSVWPLVILHGQLNVVSALVTGPMMPDATDQAVYLAILGVSYLAWAALIVVFTGASLAGRRAGPGLPMPV